MVQGCQPGRRIHPWFLWEIPMGFFNLSKIEPERNLMLFGLQRLLVLIFGMWNSFCSKQNIKASYYSSYFVHKLEKPHRKVLSELLYWVLTSLHRFRESCCSTQINNLSWSMWTRIFIQLSFQASGNFPLAIYSYLRSEEWPWTISTFQASSCMLNHFLSFEME